jgi:hypothetical protein
MPASFVVPFRATLVDVFVMVIAANGTTPPVLSVIVPLISPRVCPRTGRQSTAATKETKKALFMLVTSRRTLTGREMVAGKTARQVTRSVLSAAAKCHRCSGPASG